MNGHKVTLMNKKNSEIDIVYFKDVQKLIYALPDIYNSGFFYVELDLETNNLTLEDYKKILLSNPEIKEYKFPEEIKTVQDMEEWIDAWKTLEEIYELSSLK